HVARYFGVLTEALEVLQKVVGCDGDQGWVVDSDTAFVLTAARRTKQQERRGQDSRAKSAHGWPTSTIASREHKLNHRRQRRPRPLLHLRPSLLSPNHSSSSRYRRRMQSRQEIRTPGFVPGSGRPGRPSLASGRGALAPEPPPDRR